MKKTRIAGLVVVFIVLLVVIGSGCSKNEYLRFWGEEECCMADFATDGGFKVSSKHVWKKEF